MIEDPTRYRKTQMARFRSYFAAGRMGSQESAESLQPDLSDSFIVDKTSSSASKLHQIVKEYLNDETRLHEIVDKIKTTGSDALRVLRDNDTDRFDGTTQSALEAIVRTDGSRPSFLVRNGTIDFHSSPAGEWKDKILHYRDALENLFENVGRINVGNVHVGTGFVISENLIVTNRHVLAGLLRPAQDTISQLELQSEANIDFGFEFRGKVSLNRRRILEVAYLPAGPIGRDMVEDKLDLVVLRVEPLASDAPTSRPLAIDTTADWSGIDDLIIVGYPAPPDEKYHYRESLLEQLFEKTYGHKRIAPGLRIAGLAPEKFDWCTSHDASTLGGNSGSPIVILANSHLNFASGLHYGFNGENNRCHILGRVLDQPDRRSGKSLREVFEKHRVQMTVPNDRLVVSNRSPEIGPLPQDHNRQDRMREFPRCVCRVEDSLGRPLGTGFLIDKDCVLTCYHVVRDRDPMSLHFRFDFTDRIPASSLVPSTGRELVIYSEAADIDPSQIDPQNVFDDRKRLDYAIIRLVSSPGHDDVRKTGTSSQIRGWIELPTKPIRSPYGPYLAIVQYPLSAARLQTEKEKAILGLSATRFVHSNYTYPGSSGSPCFDWFWNLIGVHEAGFNIHSYKQAISVEAISQDLAERQFAFPGPPPTPISEVLELALPRGVDFRPRIIIDPTAEYWKQKEWTAEALLVTVFGFGVSVRKEAQQSFRLLKCRLEFPQFVGVSKSYLWGWQVNLNQAGTGFLGHVADVKAVDILPGETYLHDVMFKPVGEASGYQLSITWREFVAFIEDSKFPELSIIVTFEFIDRHISVTYHLARTNLAALLSQFAKENGLGIARFIQPVVHRAES